MSFSDESVSKARSKGVEDGAEVDQMERFLGLVDWGNVPKPPGWEEGDEEMLKDAPADGEGEVEDVEALARRLGAVDVMSAERGQEPKKD